MLCCEPHETFFESQLHFSRDDLLLLVEWFAKFVFKIGETYKLPIIDLSRTMNPFDKSHYGQSPTQPSNKAGQFIVDLIVHVIAKFDFESADRKAMIFYGMKFFFFVICFVCLFDLFFFCLFLFVVLTCQE